MDTSSPIMAASSWHPSCACPRSMGAKEDRIMHGPSQGNVSAFQPASVKSLAEAFDLFRFLAHTCELLHICLRTPDEKLALPRAERFNQLANQLLYTFTLASNVLKQDSLHDALAVR